MAAPSRQGFGHQGQPGRAPRALEWARDVAQRLGTRQPDGSWLVPYTQTEINLATGRRANNGCISRYLRELGPVVLDRSRAGLRFSPDLLVVDPPPPLRLVRPEPDAGPPEPAGPTHTPGAAAPPTTPTEAAALRDVLLTLGDVHAQLAGLCRRLAPLAGSMPGADPAAPAPSSVVTGASRAKSAGISRDSRAKSQTRGESFSSQSPTENSSIWSGPTDVVARDNDNGSARDDGDARNNPSHIGVTDAPLPSGSSTRTRDVTRALKPLLDACAAVGHAPSPRWPRGVEEALAPYDDDVVAQAVEVLAEEVRVRPGSFRNPVGVLVAAARRGEERYFGGVRARLDLAAVSEGAQRAVSAAEAHGRHWAHLEDPDFEDLVHRYGDDTDALRAALEGFADEVQGRDGALAARARAAIGTEVGAAT